MPEKQPENDEDGGEMYPLSGRQQIIENVDLVQQFNLSIFFRARQVGGIIVGDISHSCFPASLPRFSRDGTEYNFEILA
jgi:hypothetical protein